MPASSIGWTIRCGRGVRRAVETIGGATDYLEQYFAVNVVFEPLVGELFRSGFIMQVAASQNDFMTPAVVSAAEGDFERNLANTVELFRMLTMDEAHGAHNRELFNSWLAKHGAEALNAAHQLQPIWSQPRVKIAQFTDSFEQSRNRLQAIGAEIGLDVRPVIGG